MYAIKQPCARGGRRGDQWHALPGPGGIDSCQSSHRGGIRITLDTDQLACKEEGAAGLELEGVCAAVAEN